MKQLTMCALALAYLAVCLAPIRAGGHGHHGCDCCAPAPCCEEKKPTTVKKTLYEVKMQKKEITIVEEKVVPIEKVCQEKVCELVPTWTEEKRTITCYRKVPRTIEKQICCCCLVPECVTDPCTGCTRTCCKSTAVVKTVKCTVWDCVAEQREVIEKVCKMVPTEKIVERKVCCGLMCVDEKKKEIVTYITLVPLTVEEKVPPPAPKPCPAPCAAKPCCH